MGQGFKKKRAAVITLVEAFHVFSHPERADGAATFNMFHQETQKCYVNCRCEDHFFLNAEKQSEKLQLSWRQDVFSIFRANKTANERPDKCQPICVWRL